MKINIDKDEAISIKEFSDKWLSLIKVANSVGENRQQALSDYKKDIAVIKMTARLKRLNVRRFKIAIKKAPKTIFKGCYPIDFSDTEKQIKDNTIMIDVNFNYDSIEIHNKGI